MEPTTQSPQSTHAPNTQTISILTGPEEVFAFLAEPANLPRWAIGFAKDVRRDGERWVVTTGQGEMEIRYETDAAAGVIDFRMTPAPGVEAVAYSRVVPNGAGSEYVFTQLQAPGMPDEVFAGQVRALTHELTTLKAVLEVECPL